MTTFVFPGQDSHQKGMGGNIFDKYPDLTAQADRILGYSIKELCMEYPNLNLSFTQYTQPALYTVNFLCYLMEFMEIGTEKILTGLINRITKEVKPLVIKDATTGSPLGETQEPGTKMIETDADRPLKIFPLSLGSSAFKKNYNLRYAYLSGGMYHGIASAEMVIKMGKAGMMGFFGTGGLELSVIETNLQYIQKELSQGQAYGMNLVCNINDPQFEEKTVDLFLRYGVKNIETAAFLNVTPALVKYRAKSTFRILITLRQAIYLN